MNSISDDSLKQIIQLSAMIVRSSNDALSYIANISSVCERWKRIIESNDVRTRVFLNIFHPIKIECTKDDFFWNKYLIKRKYMTEFIRIEDNKKIDISDDNIVILNGRLVLVDFGISIVRLLGIRQLHHLSADAPGAL